MKEHERHGGLWMIPLVALLSVMTLGYFAVQVYRYYEDPFATTLAYAYQVEEAVELSGYVVRSETVLPGEASEYLRQRRTEGERVSAGGVVAVVYADQTSVDRQSEKDALSARLEQLRYARDTALGVEVSSRLDSQIFRRMLDYRTDLAADRLGKAEAHGGQLRAMILKRDYTHTDPANLDVEIADAEARLSELDVLSAQAVREITAPVSGLYSAVVDGYEEVLTPEAVRGLTPSEFLRLVEPVENGPEEEQDAPPVGKLVLGDAWYYAVPLSAVRAEELTRRANHGASLKLRFSKGVERDFPVTLDSVSEEEGGQVMVLFRSSLYLSEITVPRRQKAQLILGTVEGLRVPKEALRMPPPEGTDAVSTIGLYCVVGAETRFKPVTVRYTGDNFLLVASAAKTEMLRLRPGDEVIIRGENLYDRKIVTTAG